MLSLDQDALAGRRGSGGRLVRDLTRETLDPVADLGSAVGVGMRRLRLLSGGRTQKSGGAEAGPDAAEQALQSFEATTRNCPQITLTVTANGQKPLPRAVNRPVSVGWKCWAASMPTAPRSTTSPPPSQTSSGPGRRTRSGIGCARPPPSSRPASRIRRTSTSTTSSGSRHGQPARAPRGCVRMPSCTLPMRSGATSTGPRRLQMDTPRQPRTAHHQARAARRVPPAPPCRGSRNLPRCHPRTGRTALRRLLGRRSSHAPFFGSLACRG